MIHTLKWKERTYSRCGFNDLSFWFMIHDSERRNRRRRSSIRMFQVERNMIHNSWFKLWKKDVLWNIFGQSSEIHDSWFTLWNERRELIQELDLVTYLSNSWFTIQREEIGDGEILEECFKWKEVWFTIHDSCCEKKMCCKIFFVNQVRFMIRDSHSEMKGEN